MEEYSKPPYGPDPLVEAKKHLAALQKRPDFHLFRPEDCGGLIRDPAIEKFGWIRENPDKFFRLTPKTVSLIFIFGIAVPGTLLFSLKRMLRNKDIREGKPPRDMF